MSGREPDLLLPVLPEGWRWERRGERWMARHPHGWGWSAPATPADLARLAVAAWRWRSERDA